MYGSDTPLSISFRIENNGEVYPLDGIGKVVLMQFTGLKDKNGKEIYEGDIVPEVKQHWDDANTKLHSSTGVIEWNDYDGRFWARDLEIEACSSIRCPSIYFECEVHRKYLRKPRSS